MHRNDTYIPSVLRKENIQEISLTFYQSPQYTDANDTSLTDPPLSPL